MIILSITALKDTICRVLFDTGEYIDLPLDIIYKYALNKGKEINDELYNQIKYDLDLIEIKQKAIKFASYKNRTNKEVFQKLKSLDYPNEMIEKTIVFLNEFNYLDDKQYAISYIKDNLKIKSKSLGKIKSELIIKGIDRYLLEDIFLEFSDNDDELENCKKMINKKINTTKAKDEKELRFKITNFLIYKGFRKDIISMAFDELSIFILLFISTISIFANPTDSCKIRLPETINSYQPAIIPVMSLDGKSLYFDRKLHPENSGGLYDEDDIWYSEFNGTFWKEPTPTNIWNSNSSDVLFYITPDGSKALKYGQSLTSGHRGLNPGYHLINNFKSEKNVSQLRIQNYQNKAKNFYATMSYDANILITSAETDRGYGELDLYVSFYNPKKDFWSEPKNLGKLINSKWSEGSAFLSYDKKTIYFTSTRDGGFGQNDLYYSKRLDDTWENWSEPQNLGKSFNSQFDENSIWLNATCDTAIITSSDTNIRRPGIYQICIPDQFKSDPYNIIKLKTNLERKTHYQISINQKESNYIISDNGTDSYLIIPKDDFAEIIIDFEGYKPQKLTLNYQPTNKPNFIYYNIDLEKINTEKLEFRDTVFFDFSQYTWKMSDLEKFNLALKLILKNEKNYSCILSGYTDTIGNDSDNLVLSKKRVETVLNELKNFSNIEIDKLNYYGEDKSNQNSPKFCRRVEIYIRELEK